MVDTPLSLSQGSGVFEDQLMKPAVFHETRVSACRCGARLTLTRPMMQIGRAITCPACGHVSRVWQLIVRSNREETLRG